MCAFLCGIVVMLLILIVVFGYNTDPFSGALLMIIAMLGGVLVIGWFYRAEGFPIAFEYLAGLVAMGAFHIAGVSRVEFMREVRTWSLTRYEWLKEKTFWAMTVSALVVVVLVSWVCSYEFLSAST